MKQKIVYLIAISALALALALNAAPSPTPSPLHPHVPLKKVTPTSKKIPPNYHKDPAPPPKPTPKPKLSASPKPKLTATPKPKSSETPKPTPKAVPSPTPPFVPIKIPGKDDGNPTPSPTSTFVPIKIPGKNNETPTPTPKKLVPGSSATPTASPKKLIPGSSATPAPTPKKLVPEKKVTPTPSPAGDKDKNKKDVHAWINIDVVPPPPSLLGPPAFVGNPPAYHAIRPSETNYLSDGIAPVPANYVTPSQTAPVEISPTALRAWNGQEPPARAFDQTRVKVLPARDGTSPWQFYWKTTGPKAQAARWEVATVPFLAGFTAFPPAGLVGYGDASANAESPLSENFFAVDFNSLSKSFADGSRPNKYYMRVLPIDLDGNPAGTASNFVRIDLP